MNVYVHLLEPAKVQYQQHLSRFIYYSSCQIITIIREFNSNSENTHLKKLQFRSYLENRPQIFQCKDLPGEIDAQCKLRFFNDYVQVTCFVKA